MASIFMKIPLWVLIKELPSVMNKTVIVTMLLSQCSIKIQGPKWTKENFKDFQGLEKGLLKFKGFQDAYEPWLRDKNIFEVEQLKLKSQENQTVCRVLTQWHSNNFTHTSPTEKISVQEPQQTRNIQFSKSTMVYVASNSRVTPSG